MKALLLALLSISTAAAPPKDFDRHWRGVRRELKIIPLDATLAPVPAASDEKAECFKADWRSLRNIRVRAWYCRPRGNGPFPAVLISPWYGRDRVDPPSDMARRGVAALSFQGRGFEVDQTGYPAENYRYALSGIERAESYVFRELVAHGLRGLDFLEARPEIDRRRIAAMGASQGGGLSLLLAGLDRRVSLVSADFPFLSDWEGSIASAGGIYGEVRAYLEQNPASRPGVLKTLSFLDALSAAERVRAPALIQLGLKDEVCPAAGIRKVYARLGSRDKRLVERDAGHGELNAERWRAMSDFVVERLAGTSRAPGP